MPPSPSPFRIRRLQPGEGSLYREIRLAALRESPQAFATTYEYALARTEESWATQADTSAAGADRATFIAFHGESPVGLAALYRSDAAPREGELIQVWVAPAQRGGPLAVELTDAVVAWARTHGFDTIRAEVTMGNARALRFYLRYGFLQEEQGSPSASSLLLTLRLERR